MFNLSAQHPDYAGKGMAWASSGGELHSKLPDEVTLRLEAGIPIGGTVQDDAGHPLEGVAVLLFGSGYQGYSTGTGEASNHEYPQVSRASEEKPAAFTDSKGHWTFSHFPKDLRSAEITLIRPDKSRQAFATERERNFTSLPVVRLNALKDQSAQFTLRNGATVRGIVLDEAGQPLAGVSVKEGYGAYGRKLIAEFKTDDSGRFERQNRVPRQWIYTASAPGRATVSQVIDVGRTAPEVRIVLPPASPLVLRVKDSQGKPVAGARIQSALHQVEPQFLDWSGLTDAEGRVVWTNAPATEVNLSASIVELGAHREFKAKASDGQRELVLDPKAAERVKVRVEAVDSAARKPVTLRNVAIRYDWPWLPFKTLAQPGTNICDLEVRASDFQPDMSLSYVLRFEADGYDAQTTENLSFFEGDQNLVIVMEGGGKPEGVVLAPDGSPAAGARIWARSPAESTPLFANEPGRFYGDRMIKAQADSNGRYSIPAQACEGPVVFTHADGLAQTSLADLKRQRDVRLEKWGQIQGEFIASGEPRSGASIMLSTLSWAPDLGLHIIFNTTSDAEGQFAFPKVPPGEYKLYRNYSKRAGPIVESHQLPVTVKAGETVKLKYGGEGRTVIGLAKTDQGGVVINWQNDSHVLTLKQEALPALNVDDFATAAAYQKAQKESYKSPARLRQLREARTYQLLFDTDGGFRAEDVPPGNYELRIHLTKPNEGERFRPVTRPEDDLGELVRDVVVPQGTNTFDLGTLIVPVKASSGLAKAAPVQLVARDLDGNPLALSDFRGRYVLLTAWAPWSERSIEPLKMLDKLQADFAGEKRLAFLHLSFDEDAERTRQTVLQRRYHGQHAQLEGEALAQAADQLNLEVFPTLYLLDPEGRIMARDLDGARLHAALERALKK